MRFRKTILLIVFPLACVEVAADTTYTKAQLNRMAASGVYPSQGPITQKHSTSMSFSNCKRAAENVMSQLRGAYPVETVVDTSVLHIVKSWANDGVTMVTCSKPDTKMLITRAGYQ